MVLRTRNPASQSQSERNLSSSHDELGLRMFHHTCRKNLRGLADVVLRSSP